MAVINPIVERGIVVFRHFGHKLDVPGGRSRPAYCPVKMIHGHDPSNMKIYCSSHISSCLQCHAELAIRELAIRDIPFSRGLEFLMGGLILSDYEFTWKVDTDLHQKYPGLVCPQLRNFL